MAPVAVTTPAAPTAAERAALRVHLDALVRASQAIHSAPDAVSIGRALVAAAVDMLGSARGIWGTYADGVITYRDRWRDGAWAAAALVLGADPTSTTARVIAERRGFVWNDAADDLPAQRDVLAATGVRNFVIVPLVGKDDGLVGVVSLQNKLAGAAFTDDDLAILASLAAIAVTAFDNDTARRRAMRSEARERFLARASVVLAESLDFAVTLRQVADTIVPEIADWCTITVVDEAGIARRLAGVHGDPARAGLMRDYLDGFEPAAHRSAELRDAVRAGHSTFYPVVRPELLTESAQNAEHLALMRGLGCTSAIVAPLIVRGVSIGALSLVIADGRRAFDDADHQLGRELAARIAMAVERARQFAAERSARERAEHAEADYRALDIERTRLLREAEAAARAKDEFLAILGHELRNPLAPILTALELMDAAGAHAHELQVIERQTRHLVRLVDDLLDVSRIARGKVELVRERLELQDVTHDAVEIVQPLLEARRHRLHLDVPAGTIVVGDATRLAQVVVNLLTNAVKYTEPGGALSIRATRVGDQISYRVRDSGIGIAADMLPRVFDMFVQTSQPLARLQGGLGLGLTLVRNLVELHGGSVIARSDGVGLGTEIEVLLPAAGDVPIASAPAATPAVVAATGRRVLVVDDNEDAADLMAAALERWGYVVKVARDATEALASVGAFGPSAAILDIGLPEIDGYELARRLRAMPEHATTCLIAVTGYGQATDRERALAAGFDRHLVKPVSAARIREILEST